MKSIYGLVGAGGHGREVMPLIQGMLQEKVHSGMAEIFFVTEYDSEIGSVNGINVISLEDFLNDPRDKEFNISIANSLARERIANDCINRGAKPLAIKADNSVMLVSNDIGPGSIISPFVTITSNIKIGKFFHANMYSYVAHDCVIGDYVTFGPSVKCNGNVVIEDHAYVGAGASIVQGSQDKPLIIGRGAIVGMGAVVTKNVPPYVTVVGNPARLLIKNSQT